MLKNGEWQLFNVEDNFTKLDDPFSRIPVLVFFLEIRFF